MPLLAAVQAKPVAKKAKAGADVSAAKGSKTIFVGNLAWSATEDDLANFFAQCGEVADVRIRKFLCCEQTLHSLVS